jgi:hypothetical protein
MTLMSKTNHTSYGAAATSERELTEDDLALVSGGRKPPGGDVPVKYMEIKLQEVLISG